MVKVIWTVRSLTDLEEFGEYISKDSSRFAKLTIHHSSRLLSNNPAFKKK